MTPAAPHLHYHPEVDGLRAVAVVPVILFHAGIEVFRGGFVGVDIFFVISGYLITTILLAEKTAGRFTLVAFYERRARRILPALFFVMLACLPFAWLRMTPDEVNDFSKSIAGVALFSSNIFFWHSTGYFDSIAEEKLLLHTWSLGVEEQYYVFFPLLLMATWRYGRQRQALTFALLTLISFALCEWASRNSPDANFYLLPTRAWELLIGSVLAVLSFNKPLHERVSVWWANTLSVLGLLLVFAAIFTMTAEDPFPSYRALIPVLGTALILAYSNSNNIVGRALATRPLIFLGLISYSAYLWHQPLFAMARLNSAALPSQGIFLALSALSLILAYLTWRFVERPFRDRRAISRRLIFIASLAGTLLFLAIGATGALKDGFPARLDSYHQALLETATPSPKRDECHAKSKDSPAVRDACVYIAPQATWAAFGDSHMVELAYAGAERLADRNEGLLHLTYSNCPPAILYESSVNGCSDWQRDALARIEQDDNIQNVIVGFRYSAALFGDQLDVYPKIPDKAPRIEHLTPTEARDLVWSSFTTILNRLRKAGKRVYVIGPIPELDRDVRNKIVAAQFKHETHFQIGTSREWYEARNRFVTDRLRALPWDQDLLYVDPSTTLCNKNNCIAVEDARALYFDDDHISIHGARKVAKLVLDQ